MLALTANHFDPVPLDKMIEAEHAVREAASTIADDITARFDTADKLSDPDRAAILAIATTALAPFLPKAETKQ